MAKLNWLEKHENAKSKLIEVLDFLGLENGAMRMQLLQKCIEGYRS